MGGFLSESFPDVKAFFPPFFHCLSSPVSPSPEVFCVGSYLDSYEGFSLLFCSLRPAVFCVQQCIYNLTFSLKNCHAPNQERAAHLCTLSQWLTIVASRQQRPLLKLSTHHPADLSTASWSPARSSSRRCLRYSVDLEG